MNNKNEFYRYLDKKDIPKWEKNVPFSAQSRDTQQFWLNELDKVKNGLRVGNTFISPWLYWHVNFWSMYVDISADERILTKPDLRDNEWYINHFLLKAKEQRKGIILFGTRRFGKALRDNEGILYDDGVYRPIGKAKIGDKIFGADGKLTNIVGVYPQGKIQLYRVELGDGRSIECSDDHLWEVFDYQAKRFKTLPLKEIRKNYKFDRFYSRSGKTAVVHNYYLPLTKPIQYKKKDLPIDPYFLGLWLGDCARNQTRITNPDKEIIDYIKNYAKELGLTVTTYKYTHSIVGSKGRKNPLREKLRELGIFSYKRIPEIYLTSSVDDRMELLRGLMDSDGYISVGGSIDFTQTSKDLLYDVYRLLLELGIKAELVLDFKTNYLKDGEYLTSNRINIFTDKDIFKLSRKKERADNRSNRNITKIDLVAITDIVKTDVDYATCIRVDNKDSLFITKDAIVTHNSAYISSHTGHSATINKGSLNSVVGGSQKDLDNITAYIDDGLDNVPYFFHHNRVGTDWSKGVVLGTKTVTHKKDIFSRITVTNVDMGKKFSTQKTAGATPKTFVIDEIGKFNVKKTFNTAKYSFSTPFGWRVVPILLGTGGEVEMSQDAQEILANPDIHNLIEMDWDFLEKNVETPTWTRKKWGIFVPAQMSIEPGLIKKDTNLADYLKVKDKQLQKIKIKVTEWERSTKILQDRRKALEKDPDTLTDETMFLPLDPDDCFLQTGSNPFPTIEGRKHLDKIIESGDIGKPVEIYKEGGKYAWEFSDKKIADFPFKGGNIDAPVIMFEDPPDDNEKNYTYVGGLDHYKHNKADTDSLGVMVIFKRKVNLDAFAHRIVAIYASRPSLIDRFNTVAENLMKAYGAEILQENADVSFEQHLIRKGEAEYWLAEGEAFVKKYVKSNYKQNNKFGLVPNAKNKEYLLKLVIDYTQEEILIGTDDEGNKIFIKGIERINDVGLLKELINFKYGANHDRITAFGHALAWARYLDDLNILPKTKIDKESESYKQKKRKQQLKSKGFYSLRRSGKFY